MKFQLTGLEGRALQGRQSLPCNELYAITTTAVAKEFSEEPSALDCFLPEGVELDGFEALWDLTTQDSDSRTASRDDSRNRCLVQVGIEKYPPEGVLFHPTPELLADRGSSVRL